MAFTKITSSDLANKGVIGLPDVPGLSTSNMQIKLEETARDVIIPKHNGLIDELEANTGASNIGATAPTGLVGTNVQSLIDDLNLKKENNSSALASTDTAEANDTFNIRKVTTTYKIAFSDLVNSIKTFIGSATSSAAGFFSAEDKTKLDGIEDNANDYSLPIASSSELGGIKVGNNLQIAADGTLSATGSGSGDMTKAVYDTNDNGIVDAAESVPWSGVSSTPTTLSGFGITDAYTKTEVDTALGGKVSDAYKRVTVGATNVDASGEDALEIEAGTGMTITANASTKKIVFASTGGGTADAYKTIKVGSTDIVASGADTFEIKAGSNVSLTPDALGKSVTINASGGGQSTGDMLASDYDPNFDVKNTTGGIPAYVAAQIPTGDKGVIIANGVAKAALNNEAVSTLASAVISTTQNRQYAVGLDSNSKLSVNVPWENTTYSAATTSADGLMSSSDKSKLNGITAGAEPNVQADWNEADNTADGYIKNKPTIPTVDQTYSSSSANAQSGTAVASAVSGKADTTDLDGWTATSTVSSSGTVTFTGLDDSYGYDLYCSDKLLGISAMSKTGSSTNVSITYTVTGAASGDLCKLRILK